MDKFGRSPSIRSNTLPDRWKAFSINKNGHFNFQNKKLCNVKAPEADLDCANKKYVDDIFEALSNKFSEEMVLLTTSYVDKVAKRVIDILNKEVTDIRILDTDSVYKGNVLKSNGHQYHEANTEGASSA